MRDKSQPQRDKAASVKAVPAKAASVKGERIAKILSRAGIASRREAEKMILAGRVKVNGATISTPALNILPSHDVLVDGQPLAAPEPSRLWRYHKPRGLITTRRDPQSRASIFDQMPSHLPPVMPIGRLDINTEGLLLLTNDGGLKRYLELPQTGWIRRYRVRAFGTPQQARLETIKKGAKIDGIIYRGADIQIERQQGGNSWLTIAVREGKNREIKNLLAYAGLQVNRLIRLSFGSFQLGNLPVGKVEEVPRAVLRQQLGTAFASLAAGKEPSVPTKSRNTKKTHQTKQPIKKKPSKPSKAKRDTKRNAKHNAKHVVKGR